VNNEPQLDAAGRHFGWSFDSGFDFAGILLA
jgi:hypothetical protein